MVSPAVGSVTVPSGTATVGEAGTGVFCGPGAGVFVGVSVSRGSGVSVGGTGVSVGGTGVSGGSAVGVSVNPSSGMALLELVLDPINARTNTVASIREPMTYNLFIFLSLITCLIYSESPKKPRLSGPTCYYRQKI